MRLTIDISDRAADALRERANYDRDRYAEFAGVILERALLGIQPANVLARILRDQDGALTFNELVKLSQLPRSTVQDLLKRIKGLKRTGEGLRNHPYRFYLEPGS